MKAAAERAALAVIVLDARANETSSDHLEDRLWAACDGDPCTYAVAMIDAAKVRRDRALALHPAQEVGVKSPQTSPPPSREGAATSSRQLLNSLARRTARVGAVHGSGPPPARSQRIVDPLLIVAVPVATAVLAMCAFIVADFARSIL